MESRVVASLCQIGRGKAGDADVKRTVLILSLIAPVLLYVIGGFFFASSGFCFDVEAPPTSPQRIVGALAGYIPGLILAIIARGLRLSAPARTRYVSRFVSVVV